MQVQADKLWELVFPRLQAQLEEGKLTIDDIVEFTKAHPTTVKGWLDQKSPANGDRLMRLWVLLAFAGSDSLELDQVPALNRLLLELYAFDVFTLSDVQLYAGYKSDHSGKIFNMFRGTPLMHPEVTIEQLESGYGEDLREKQQYWLNKWEIPTDQPVEIEEPAPQASSDQSTTAEQLATPSLSGDPILLLATLLGAATPLAKHLNSNATTASERSAFRSLIGHEVLFELSNTLNALTSERAREMTK